MDNGNEIENYVKSVEIEIEEGKQQIDTVQTFDEFLQQFEDLFKRTISEEEKEEVDFAAEYARLV